MDNPLIETWSINQRMVLYILDAIAPAALSGVSLSKGRSVGAVFAHIHAVRVMWLEVALPKLKLHKVAKEDVTSKAKLQSALKASGEAMTELFTQAATTGKVKGFKRSPTTFMGYLIAHEGYHLGEIGMTLKQAGHPLDEKAAYGMWEWGKL